MDPVSPVLLHDTNALPETVFAKDQPEYRPLPAVITDRGERITTRWRLTWRERVRAAWSGSVYLQVLTFGRPLQPVVLTVEELKFGMSE